jgi:diguanylate cyclase (GGDEF)-like protein
VELPETPNSADASIDILIVDSVRLFHKIITQVFTGTRLKPHFAESAAAALDRVDNGDFAIVCGALHLPDMTGIELCRRLRQLPKGKVTPFILLTANSPQAFIRDAYAAGVTDVFEKQLLEPLVIMLQRLLAHREPATGTVLIVEDASAQAAFFVGVLGAIGLQCDVVKSAEEALVNLAESYYDLVVMDIMLAGCMSGVTLANQIRRLPGARGEVPILAATAFDDLSRRIELFHLGIDDYIIKPVVSEELTARARNLISHYRLLQQTRAARSHAEAEREEAIRALAHRASHDVLTGLANRWMFEERLAEALDVTTAVTTGMALLDVGALRIVNDSCGHAAGDALMQEVGRRASAVDTSLIARYEGGRLGLLVQGVTPGARGEALVSLVSAIEAQPFVWGERSFALRLVGGALLSLVGIGVVTDVLARAETAVAAAHASGASGLLFYDASDDRIAAREREKSSLPPLLGALDHGRLVLFMQRIAPLDEHDARQGFEFLCRMQTPDGALVSPAGFLPAAERYGLMPRLDRQVTALALDWLAAHHKHNAGRPASPEKGIPSGHADFFTINLSGQTIGDLGFVDFVREKLASSGAPAACIYFEITETAVVADPDAAVEFMALLGKLGCRFALDDFGSGSASYGQLKQLPVHLIKIDGQFVDNILDNALDQAIVRSTCEVARALNLPIVAEFVENAAQMALLKELGVDYVQGYAIDRPEAVTPVTS